MTDAELIRIAREAGLGDGWLFPDSPLLKAMRAAVEAEREACALVAEAESDSCESRARRNRRGPAKGAAVFDEERALVAARIADAIRARGEGEG